MNNIKYLSLKDTGTFVIIFLFAAIFLLTEDDDIIMEKCQKTQSFETCLHTLQR